jgi:radical SAM-linked protein
MTSQRIRLRYTKQGRVRFVSARDMTSVWERALRRAGLPIAYSQGFSPHPKVSFPDALPVGYASTGEYAELTFAAPIDPGPGLGRLSATLPTGMDITTYVIVPDGARKLASYLTATLWELEFARVADGTGDALVDELERRSATLLASDRFEITRHRPTGDRVLDVRAPIEAIATHLRGDDPRQPAPVLRAVLRNDGPTIRPTDLESALRRLGDVALPPARRLRRLAQGTPVDDGLREALTQQIERLTPERSAEAA